MKFVKMLGVAAVLAAGAMGVVPAAVGAPAAAPAASTVITVGHVKAVTALLEAMQAEKMMRTTASLSKYANEAQRASVFAKLDKMPKEQIYARLAYPLAKAISAETATEMTRFITRRMANKSSTRCITAAAACKAWAWAAPRRPTRPKRKK